MLNVFLFILAIIMIFNFIMIIVWQVIAILHLPLDKRRTEKGFFYKDSLFVIMNIIGLFVPISLNNFFFLNIEDPKLNSLLTSIISISGSIIYITLFVLNIIRIKKLKDNKYNKKIKSE